MANTLYMVIEHFKGGDAVAVYRRFRDHGRLAPDGLSYVSSWVDARFECCYQLMETSDPQLLDQVERLSPDARFYKPLDLPILLGWLGRNDSEIKPN